VSTVDLLLAAVSTRTERLFVVFVVVIALGGAILFPFTRRIGGNQAKGGGPGGSEPDIVGVTWFLVALGAGIYLAASYVGGSGGVG
jgi:hypothetical protein